MNNKCSMVLALFTGILTCTQVVKEAPEHGGLRLLSPPTQWPVDAKPVELGLSLGSTLATSDKRLVSVGWIENTPAFEGVGFRRSLALAAQV
jgi:hypothetical protein